MKYYLLNVFSKDGKNGNQLAAVFPDKEITSEQKQNITRNFNFSETIFLDPKNIHSISIFTPNGELPFAGHPTVGAGWLLHHLGKDIGKLIVPLGEIQVKADAQKSKVSFPGTPIVKNVQGSLDDLFFHSKVPKEAVELSDVRHVNSGPEFTLVPLKSHEALKNASSPISLKERNRTYYVYNAGSDRYFVRMFGVTVAEDAATGSAALCALAGYLREVKNQTTGNLVISQGSEMNRECEIHLSWDQNNIFVGGEVLLWGEGLLKI